MTDATAPPAEESAPTAGATIHTTREIEALIPHRWPFLLVDRIVEYDAEAKRIVGIKAVTATEWFFQGHFPGLPVMPGVLQVEALAQTMAVYVAKQPASATGSASSPASTTAASSAIVSPGRHAPPRGHDGEARLAASAAAGRSRRSTARSPARRPSASSSRDAAVLR